MRGGRVGTLVAALALVMSFAPSAAADAVDDSISLLPDSATSPYYDSIQLMAGSASYLAFSMSPSRAPGQPGAAPSVLDVRDSAGQVRTVQLPEEVNFFGQRLVPSMSDYHVYLNGSLLVAAYYGIDYEVSWFDLASGASGTGPTARLPGTADNEYDYVVAAAPDGWVTMTADGKDLWETTTEGKRTSLDVPTSLERLNVEADERGLLVGDGFTQLDYMRWSQPGTWTAVSTGTTKPVFCSDLLGDAAGCAIVEYGSYGSFTSTDVLRVPISGGPVVDTPVVCGGTPQLTPTTTVWAQRCAKSKNSKLASVPAGGGPVTVSSTPISSQVGYFAAASQVFAVRPQSAAEPAELVMTSDASNVSTVLRSDASRVAASGIALGDGYVEWQDDQSAGGPVWRRSMAPSDSGITLGPAHKVKAPNAFGALQTSAGWTTVGDLYNLTVFGHGRTLSLPQEGAVGPNGVSGHRALVETAVHRFAILNLKTAHRNKIAGHGHEVVVAAGLDGNRLAYIERNGSVWCRDLGTGKEVRLRAAKPDTPPVKSALVSIHGDIVGWDLPPRGRADRSVPGEVAYRGTRPLGATVHLPTDGGMVELTSAGPLYLHAYNGDVYSVWQRGYGTTGEWRLYDYNDANTYRVLGTLTVIKTLMVRGRLMAYLDADGQPKAKLLP